MKYLLLLAAGLAITGCGAPKPPSWDTGLKRPVNVHLPQYQPPLYVPAEATPNRPRRSETK